MSRRSRSRSRTRLDSDSDGSEQVSLTPAFEQHLSAGYVHTWDTGMA